MWSPLYPYKIWIILPCDIFELDTKCLLLWHILDHLHLRESLAVVSSWVEDYNIRYLDHQLNKYVSSDLVQASSDADDREYVAYESKSYCKYFVKVYSFLTVSLDVHYLSYQ